MFCISVFLSEYKEQGVKDVNEEPQNAKIVALYFLIQGIALLPQELLRTNVLQIMGSCLLRSEPFIAP